MAVGDEAAGGLPELARWPATHGLVRARLLDRLRAHAQLTMIIAPAGYGKTTLLAQHASELPDPVAWLRADRLDTTPGRFVERLCRALVAAGALETFPEPRPDADTLDPALPVARVHIMIDDAHLLIGSAAERCVEDVLEQHPECSVALASRRAPNLNLGRVEVGMVTMVSADDLRFRSWEVERLFHEIYREPLPPDDIAALTRRVDGWAACLQLFHLSTQSRSLAHRRRAVKALAGGPRFARTYLARTVIDELEPRLAGFLTRTCVFEVLTAERCDALLGTEDSQDLLEELERLETFTTSEDGGRTFRYHEVLRRHLEAALFANLGGTETRTWYRRTAELLEAQGALGEAARAYLRAEHWDEASRLLRRNGAKVIEADRGAGWHDLLSLQLVNEDPWLSLALANQLSQEGRLAAAVERYRKAEALFPDASDRLRAERARRLVELWTDSHLSFGRPQPQRHQPQRHWLDRLRAAVRRNPGAAEKASDEGPGGLLADAVAALLTGTPLAAHAALAPLLADVEPDGPLPLAARLVQSAADLVTGRADLRSADELAADAERAGVVWLAHQARLLAALRAGDGGSIQRVWDQCEGAGDTWGGLLAEAAAGLHLLFSGAPAHAALSNVAKRCRTLDAGTLEAWAQSFAALAAAVEGHPEAARMGRAAESLARTTGVWGAQVLTAVALSAADPANRARHTRQAGSLARTHGLPWPSPFAQLLPGSTSAQPDAAVAVIESGPSLRLRCFGGFALEIAGRTLDWRALRPRAVTTLRLLAVQLPRPVHRELLLSLWPDLPEGRGLHSLQVAVSSLRTFLDPDGRRGSSRMIERQGDAYRLVLPPGGEADVVEFAIGLQDAQLARRAQQADSERAALSRVVAAYGGELLPEDGPAEWVINAREIARTQAAGAAARLAELAVDAGEVASAIDAAQGSLAIDPYHDGAWRTLITAYQQAGDNAAAARARRDYADMLDALGVSPPPQSPPLALLRPRRASAERTRLR